eukprot:383862-Ditylum_brightwellii.AAC.1
MPNQLAVDANFHCAKSAPHKVITTNQNNIPPPLPGLDKLKCVKEVKTTFNKFKIKISFTIPKDDKIKP